MNVTLSKKSVRILKRHNKDFDEMCEAKTNLTDRRVSALINQMIERSNDECNIIEEFGN